MKTKASLLTAIFLAPVMMLTAQMHQIKGTITNLRQQPLQGVTIHAPKSKGGAITNSQGQFSLQLSDKDKTILISAPGAEPVKLKIDPRSSEDLNISIRVLDVSDQNSGQRIEGMQPNGSYYPRINELTLSQMIDGNFPSVTYNNNGTVTIRGRLCGYYLVDGMRVPSLDVINPADIKNIKILKDPAETTIYGRQATNGVVMVETK